MRATRAMAACKWLKPTAIAAVVPMLALATAVAASAQPVMTTVVGKAEMVAAAVDQKTGAVYFASGRPGAIFQVSSSINGLLIAGTAGGSLNDGIPALQAAVFPARNGLTVDFDGNIFFSEPSLHRIRRIDAVTGLITTIAGTGQPGRVDSNFFPGDNAIFTSLAAPGALALDPTTGDLFVADEAWDIVYRITGNGSPITSSNGFIYRAVGGNPANTSIYVESLWYNPFGYSGDNGPAIDAKLNHPRGLAVDGLGDLFIADTGNNVVRRVDAATKVITTVAGNGVPGFTGDGGPGASAQLFMPTGVAIGGDRYLYIADTSNQRLRVEDLLFDVISTYAGDGVATLAVNSFAFPTGVAKGSTSVFFVVDSQNRSLAMLDRNADGGPLKTEVAHIGGSADPGYTGNGAPGGDAIDQPMAIVFDAQGNAFFSDAGNARVRRVDASTHEVTTVIGNGIPGYSGDNGDAGHAQLNCPAGLAFGAGGDLFVADTCANVVRRVAPGADGLITGAADEVITTYAGTGVRYGYADGAGGPATAARLNAPTTLAMLNGTLLLGEPDIAAIRSIAPDGTIDDGLSDVDAHAFTVDLQGNFIRADAGSRDIQCNGQETLYLPALGLQIGLSGGAAADASGSLYLTESVPSPQVFRFGAQGGGSLCSATPQTISAVVVAGTGATGYSGDNGPATSATLNHPAGLAVDAGSSIWIADSGNNVIRRVEQPTVSVAVSPATLDFGVHALQTTSATQTATATSTGTATATFSAATLGGANPQDFTIVADGCAATALAPGSQCQVTIAFRPTVAGSRSATLRFNDDAGGTPQTVALSGSGATIDVAPASISFGSQTQSIPSAATSVSVTNRGTAAVSIVSLSFSGQNAGDFAVAADSCTSAALAANATCTFGVVFTPEALGSRTATLTITSSASDLQRTVDVSGTGVAPVAQAAIAPGSVAFGSVTVGTRTAPVTITVTSAGTAPLSIVKAALTGNQPTDFILGDDTCSGATLAPAGTCTLTVTFAPVEVCSATAAVTVTDNAGDSPQTVGLSGRSVSAAGGPFQSAIYCTSHGAQPQELAAGPDGNVWFDERGSAFAPGAIARANAAAGVVLEDAGAVQNGWHPSALSIASDGSYAYLESRAGGFNEWYDIVNPVGAKLQQPVSIPGPSGLGPDDGFWLTDRFTCADNFLFQHFAPNAGTTSVVPNGQWLFFNTNNRSCLTPSFVAPGPDGLLWIGTTNQGVDVGTNAPNGFVRATLDNQIADITATTAPPLAATVGPDGSMWALVANLGVQSCSLEQIGPGGNGTPVTMDPSVLVLGCLSIVAGPDNRLWMTGMTSTFTGASFVQALVAYDPARAQWSVYPTPAITATNIYLAAGPDEGIWFDAIPSAVGRLDIGGGPSAAYVTPKMIGFPSTMVGLPSTVRSIVVRSTGTQPLTIASVVLAGKDASQFIVQNDQCGGAVLDPGQSCVVQVASRPTKAGSHVAQLVITDDDAFSPQIVRLAEFSLQQGPTIDPAAVSFPAAIVGKHGTTVTLTLTNPFDRALAVHSVSPGGANPGDFTILSDTCLTAAVPANGGTCAVAVRFDPTAAGKRTATLTFTDAANPPTQVVTLTGQGQSATGGGGTGSASCECDSNGLFVDPKIVYPAFVATAGSTGTSPHATYTLDVQQTSGKPSAFVITKKGTTTPLATINAPVASNTAWPALYGWGFSPDDDRFAVHYATYSQLGNTTSDWIDTIVLYDLKSATPGLPVRTVTLPIAPQGSAAGPSGSMAFSPKGAYLLTAQLQSTSSGQSISLNVITTSGQIVYQNVWSPAAAPADPGKTAGSAFWGFAPDEQSFAYYLQEPGDDATLLLINLPAGGAPIGQFHYANAKATKVQFAPCGEVIAIVHQASDLNQQNPVTISLYSTRPADAGLGAMGEKDDLPIKTITIKAGPVDYTADVEGYPNTVILASNGSTGSCPAPTTSGDAGGSDAPAAAVAPKFKDTFDLVAPPPPRTATFGQLYSYTFAATGTPDPTFAFLTNTCTFLTIDASTGEVSGTPTTSFASCAYSVTAVNGAGNADAGPFTITMTAPPPSGGGGVGGPYEPDDEVVPASAPAPVHAASTSGGITVTPIQTTLVLPHGRGQIVLNDDVTPGVSTFTYPENDVLGGPIGRLTFAGLDFSLTAVDTATGAPVTTIVDAPLATIVYRLSDLQSARIADPLTLSLYWWSGTAWINQMPCAGCGVDAANGTLKIRLSQPGEYILAADLPQRTLTLTPVPVSAVAGTPFSGALATFAPFNTSDLVGYYTATVDWGDGQTSEGPISASDTGTFVVAGAHTWTSAGSFAVGVTVQQDSSGGTVQTTASVSGVGQPPQFSAATPPLTGTVGVPYSYTFAASGSPAPAFALAAGAPAWLSIDATTGTVSGTPPAGTTSFTYAVIASNGVTPDATAGPFSVTVASATTTSADLSVTMTAPAKAAKGSTITYTIVATNNGPSAATKIALVLVAGPGLSTVSTSPTALVDADGLWAWTLATLAPGQSATFSLRAKVLIAGPVVAGAAISAETRDPKLTNNAVFAWTSVK